MKIIIVFAALFFAMVPVFAQAHLTTVDYQKTMQPGVEMEMPFPEKTVMKTIVDKIEKLGYRANASKGFTIFKGVVIREISPNALDLYFNAERKSRKEKDAAVVTMMLSSGFERFIGDSTNSKIIENAKTFLNNLTVEVEAYDLELQVKDQEAETKKADKKYNNLVEDGQDLQKKKARIEKDIEENVRKQAEQKAEAEKQLQIFEILKAKRKQ